ncbi:MAG TPA: glutathione S-transferase C-terminal domain-containing protein [Kofleriaceae bacterium]|nr:glutathione S-transferase C-terminal domain-containing protein [Kofleriaceae bacterium]
MELYYAPLACSLAARIVAHEAEIPLELRQVEVFARTLTETGASYGDVAPLGLVPALRLDDGSLLTEVSAVVQYLADLRPEAGLAPPWGTLDRYRLVEWLSFVATEVHKKVVWQLFNRGVPEASRAHAREVAPRVFDHLARHLAARDYLVADRFTAADAYLVWALHLARFTGLDPGADRPALTAYVRRQRARPSVAQLLAEETPQAIAAMARQPE